ncbi:hypothetical protein ACUOAQ_17985, partial [Escherichia sp. SP-MK]
MKPVQIYLGVPQTAKLQVYDVKTGKQVTIKQMIITNTNETDAKLTVTVNTTVRSINFVSPGLTINPFIISVVFTVTVSFASVSFMKPVQIYLGVPQTAKLQVYDVKTG